MASAQSTGSPTAPRTNARVAGAPSITPVFPLLVLETMRDLDRPSELLEDEDISLSMPRRLGLSEVVRIQIQRFQEEVRHKRPQGAAQVEDLVRLVVRRSDAEEIFRQAGVRVAAHMWEQRSPTRRRIGRFLPGPLGRMAAQRGVRRMVDRLAGGSRVTVNRWPMELRIRNSLTARADPTGRACAFYGGAFAELLKYYSGRPYRVLHPECEARAGEICSWTVEIAG